MAWNVSWCRFSVASNSGATCARGFCATRKVPTAELTTIFRQAADSRIVANAHRILQWRMPQESAVKGEGDFFFVERDDPAEGARLVERLFFERIPKRLGIDPADGVQLRGPGAVLAFDVTGGFDAAAEVMASFRLVTHAVILGSTDSAVQHPAGLTHRLVDPEVRAAAGITDGLLRLSVGLEDVDDLWADLVSALAAARFALARVLSLQN